MPSISNSWSLILSLTLYSHAVLPLKANGDDLASELSCAPDPDEMYEEDEEGAFMQMGMPLAAPRPNVADPTQSPASNVDEMTALLQRSLAESEIQLDGRASPALASVKGRRVSGKGKSAAPVLVSGEPVDASSSPIAAASSPPGPVAAGKPTHRLTKLARSAKESIEATTGLSISSLVSFVLLLALGVGMFFLKQWGVRQGRQARKAKLFDEAVEPCKTLDPAFDGGCDVDSEAEEEEVCTVAVEQTRAPRPTPRLSHVGTSFVVPVSRVLSCSSRSISLDVPVSPAVWPLKATFTRASPEAWEKIDLTVDIIYAAGLPPLLSCGSPDVFALAEAETDGGSGGTGAPGDIEQLSTGGTERGQRDAWLEIRSGGGVLAGHISAKVDGGYTVLRDGHPTLDIDAHLTETEYWIVVYRRGLEVAISTRLAHGKFSASCGDGTDEYIQIDTQPDTSSPESMFLLMCTLAIMVFEPSKHDQP